MGLNVRLPYVRFTVSTGSYVYRRRIPAAVRQSVGGRGEFKRLIGKTEAEAVANYGIAHQQAEEIVNQDRRKRLTLSASHSLQAPLVVCQPSERLSVKEVEPTNPLPDFNTANSQSGKPEGPTLEDAFRFYLQERAKTDPTERHQQELAIERVRKLALEIMGGDKPLTEVTRKDARGIRDHLLAIGSKVNTVKRRLADLSAVYRLAALEHDLDPRSPFAGLSFPGESSGSHTRQLRLPLPQLVIDAMYDRLAHGRRPEFLSIWTLLHLTGARLSEIAGLAVDDLKLDDPVPHIVIEPKPWRRLKNGWSERTVPLVGKALEVASRLDSINPTYVFPRFAEGRGPDSLSQALMKHLKTIRDNDKQTVHSLRHTMKDRLRDAGVGHDLQNAILGHELSKGIDASYGSGFSLERKREALALAMGP